MPGKKRTPPATGEGLRLPAALAQLEGEVLSCRRCPRLVAWRRQAGRRRPLEPYWSLPVPGFGDPRPRLLIVGLAPGAHGSNRTGRAFTGDRSGIWLYRSLHKAGFASRPDSSARGDGLRLRQAWITAAVRCAPPQNRPTPRERRNCAPFLARELSLLLDHIRVAVALGGFAWHQLLRSLADCGLPPPRPRPPFRHGAELCLRTGAAKTGARTLTLLGCYHPSQQNTFTGLLSQEMFDAVWTQARTLLERPH